LPAPIRIDDDKHLELPVWGPGFVERLAIANHPVLRIDSDDDKNDPAGLLAMVPAQRRSQAERLRLEAIDQLEHLRKIGFGVDRTGQYSVSRSFFAANRGDTFRTRTRTQRPLFWYHLRMVGKYSRISSVRKSASFQPFQGTVIQRLAGIKGMVVGS
jgi:hypothetical protein